VDKRIDAMKSSKWWWPLVMVGALYSAEVSADYVMPPFMTVVSEATIVDATIVGHPGHGKVRLQVHDVIRGENPPKEISGVWLTCYGFDLSTRLELGKRYVIFIHKSSLYEENTFYEVTPSQSDAAATCQCWDGDGRSRMTLAEFRRIVETAVE
jgi:hypothetical protein